MAATQTSNNRASLLSGLRTGGVRSATNPMAIPHTAAPGGSFQVPRFASGSHNSSHFPDEAEDELADLAQQNLYINPGANRYQPPKTAAVDGTFMHQQAPNPALPFTPAGYGNANMQAQMQMQMMQMEIMRLQAIQAQQYQAELIAQAQRQQNQAGRRPSFNPPATAGPMNTSFDLRSAQAPQLGVSFEDQVPMTAALHGRFGARLPSGPNGRTSPEENDYMPPATPSRVISGGTSLGNSGSANIVSAAPSKADGAVSWRRNGNNNSVLSGNRQPSVKITPPPAERTSPPPGLQSAPFRTKPQPLNFNAATRPVPVVVTDDSAEDGSSTGSSRSAESSPITPQSASSNEPPISPREEASKKLYQGLGMGRPVSPGVAVVVTPAPQPQHIAQRVTSTPMRQPIGPPSGELGAKNFATRVRKQAVSGLGALLAARERREVVEAY